MHHPTDRITHTTAFVTPVVENWLEREIADVTKTMVCICGMVLIKDPSLAMGRCSPCSGDRRFPFSLNKTFPSFVYFILITIIIMAKDKSP